MDFDFAAAKAENRQSVHDALAVAAVYTDDNTPATDVTVRYHTKLSNAGALEGGFGVQVLEGIDRLVFNAPQLAALGIELRHGGQLAIPQYGMAFSLDAEEPADGPVSVYWTVALVR